MTLATQEQPSVADIFRRAQVIKQQHQEFSYKQLGEQLLKEFKGASFPSLHNLRKSAPAPTTTSA